MAESKSVSRILDVDPFLGNVIFPQQALILGTSKVCLLNQSPGIVDADDGSNFGIPIAAVADLMGKPEEKINGRMTGALVIYSATFMRYAWSMSWIGRRGC
jgi:Mitochondrial pyruvate carriers